MEEKIPILCITASILSNKREARVICVQDFDVLYDEEGIALPAVYDIVTSMESRHDKR